MTDMTKGSFCIRQFSRLCIAERADYNKNSTRSGTSYSSTIFTRSLPFVLFPILKDELKGKHFNDLDELRSESNRILYSYPVEWYDQVYRQWIERHRKCIASQGVYFEKN